MITGQELEHMRRVLRLGPGDHVTLFDDGGWEHQGIIRFVGENAGEIEILQSYEAIDEPPIDITLAVGLTKGEKMDFVVEKATELGVRTVVPFISVNTVPKLDQERVEKRARRWQTIALSAAKQSGRTRIPVIHRVCLFRDWVKQPAAGALRLLFWEGEEQQTLKAVYESASDARSIIAVVGPEGGFSPEEATLAREFGFRTVGLGHRILRAETAAVAALTLVQFLWGDLG